MDITLEKIDTVRSRTGVTYRQAKEALEKHDGDVLEVLIELEESEKSWGHNIGQNITNTTDVIMDRLKETLKKGNVTKIVVKRDGNVIMNIPVTAGAIGALLSLPVTALGLTSALVAKCTIEIVKENGDVVNISDMTEKTMNKMKSAMSRDKSSNMNTNPNNADNADNANNDDDTSKMD